MSSEAMSITALKSSKEAKGKRLKIARMHLGLSRSEIERKYSISKLTQGNWEHGKAGGLTEKGAKRIVYAFKQEGLHCSVEWLMEGIGHPPYPTDKLFIGDEIERVVRHSLSLQQDSIAEELLTFRRCNSNAIDLMVQDDGMLPFYEVGDYVGGIQRYQEDLKSVVGRHCIVLLKSGESLLRHLREDHKGSYSLICINPDTTVENYCLTDQTIISAAPVIWHRQQDI